MNVTKLMVDVTTADHNSVPGRGALEQRLRDWQIAAVTVEHPPLHTVEESKAWRGKIPGVHTKNLFLKSKKGRYFLISAREDSVVDLKSLAKRLAQKKFSFADAGKLFEMLGVRPGSVTPFALMNDPEQIVTPLLDARMMTARQINFHPFVNTASTRISPDDLLKFIELCGHTPQVISLDGIG